MGLRERRLLADSNEMKRFDIKNGLISIIETEGSPTERYRLEYNINSLVIQNNEVQKKSKHIVEIYLTLGYPRQAPQCRMLSPVFHPNIAPHAICIGDHWTAGESLANLVIRIAEMLSFQSYNIQSPLNGEAAKWVDENLNKLPLERTDFWQITDNSQTFLPLPLSPMPITASISPSISTQAAAPAVAQEPIPLAPSQKRSVVESESSYHPTNIEATQPSQLNPIIINNIESSNSLIDKSQQKISEITCHNCHAIISIGQNFKEKFARCPMCGLYISLYD